MAVAVDASTPARATGATTDGTVTVTTAAFNPPAAVLVATAQCNARPTGASGAITNNGTALTWTLVAERSVADASGQMGYAGIWVAVLPASQTGMTATFTVTPVGASTTINTPTLKLYVLTGADTTTVTGGSAEGSSTTTSITTTGFTTSGDSSLGIVSACEWQAAGTLSSSDTTADVTNNSSICGLSGYKTLGTAGSSATFALATNGGSAAWDWVGVEILVAPTSPPGPPGTVTYVATSTPAAAGTTTSASTVSITPTLPTGTTGSVGGNQDRVYVIQAGNNTSGTTPTNWTALAKDVQVGPTGTAPGAGTGRRYLSIYYRDYDGAWTMPAFSLTSATQNTNALSVITLRKGATDTWDAPVASTAGNTSAASTAYSVTTGSLTTSSGMVLVGAATNDNVTASAESLSQTGATLANLTERSDTGSATGNDVSIKTYTADVTVGAAAALTHTATLSGASEGGSVVVAQSSTAAAVTPPPLQPFVVNTAALTRAASW